MTVVVERPGTEAELIAIVKRAAAAGRPVRVAGRAGRAPRWDGNDILIDLAGYNRVLRVDRAGGQATTEAGITLRRLAVALGSWGLSLENGGRRPGQALGAAISLGAHGTGAAYGAVATQVTALRLITPAGTVISCSATEDREIFDAARVGLGQLGVISTVTMRCEPGFNVRTAAASLDLGEALDRFAAYADGNNYFTLSWLPGRDRARVVTANRTDEPADGGAVDRGYRWFNRRRVWPPQFEYAVGRDESGPALRRAW
ncbi:MAG: FAD-binding protein, partial [Actinomycetota bacterium]|nr:FAD-binding protein [Actinomycetota bacterium]